MSGVIPILNAVIPLVTEYIKRRLEERGTMPTDDEIRDHLMNDADAVLIVSDAWLAAHPTN